MRNIHIHVLIKEFFQFALVAYLLLFLTETLKAGFVSYFFNLNILLGIVLGSGILMVLTSDDGVEHHVPSKRNISVDIQNSILLAVAGGLLIFFKMQELGKISLVIAILSMILIAFVSFLSLTDSQQPVAYVKKVVPQVLKLLLLPAHATAGRVPEPLSVLVQKSQARAANELQEAVEESEMIKIRYMNTNLESMYREKILPYDTLLKDALQTLCQQLEDDSLYIGVAGATTPREDKRETKREKLEKLVTLYKQNLQLRMGQLER